MHYSKLRDYAFLSQASYRNLTALPRGSGGVALEDKLTDNAPGVLNPPNRFAIDQAKLLTGSVTADPTDGYTFLHQTPNGPRGFSASVFESNAPERRTVIAIRGTEPSSIVDDILDADVLGLVLRQAAYGQLADAYRYYKKLTTPLNAQVQYTDAERTELQRLYAYHYSGQIWSDVISPGLVAEINATMAGIATDEGLGVFSGNEPAEFTGHSLGGHLAMLLGDMVARHRGTAYVGEVITFNAPGQGGLVAELPQVLGLSPWTTAISGRLTHIIGEGGMTAAGNIGGHPGERVWIDIEEASGALAPIENHSMVRLADAMSMHALLGGLDPALRPADVKAILDGASSQEARHEEALLDAMRRQLGAATGTTPTGDREAVYTALVSLAQGAAYQSLRPQNGRALITITPLSSAGDLTATAKTDFGEFMALKMLAPFVLKPKVDPNNAEATAAAADALTGVWATAHGTDFTAWLADRQARTRGDVERENTFSDQWYADRGAMLGYVLARNQANAQVQDNLNPAEDYNIQFTDVASQSELTARGRQARAGNAAFVANPIKVAFGGDGADPLNGSDIDTRGDRLYGGGGDDTLTGLGGNDYLEGGRGLDTLSGGTGRDWVLGGEGADVYKFITGDGHDVVRDRDGGRIEWSGASIGAARRVAPGVDVWESGADGYRLSLIGHTASNRGTLLIQRLAAGVPVTGDSIRIEAFDVSTALAAWGLVLQEPAAISPPTIATSRGTKGASVELFSGAMI
ncbi:MAG: hypothetical protein U5L03_00355 [Burkholderiaceae bacterium]|nr:hypothetical protein [Burkholderiaceae bacterium]